MAPSLDGSSRVAEQTTLACPLLLTLVCQKGVILVRVHPIYVTRCSSRVRALVLLVIEEGWVHSISSEIHREWFCRDEYRLDFAGF